MTCYNSIYGITKLSTLLNEYVMSFMHRHVPGNWNAAVIFNIALKRNPLDAGSRKMSKYIYIFFSSSIFYQFIQDAPCR